MIFALPVLFLSSLNPIPTGVLDVRPLTASILVIHYRDGYVIHHKLGQKRSDEIVVLPHPLDVRTASDSTQFTLRSRDDSEYLQPTHPAKVSRKSKGTDFAWFADTWVDNHAVNLRPDFAAEHWLYLHLPKPLKAGYGYQLAAPGLQINEPVSSTGLAGVSDAIHINLVGYRPDDPSKFAYVYAWEGDAGSLEVRPFVGKKFQMIDANSGRAVYSGRIAFRRTKTEPETQNLDQTPNGNFLGADVDECDFSPVKKPGRYFISVEGVGRSKAFSIGQDVYRIPFKTIMKGILGNRSGIELKPPSVPYLRPAPHNPLITPGFQGKLVYTRSRYLDRKDSDYSPEDKPAVESQIVGPLNVAGWYQDAGDWDSYETHIAVPQQLMLAYLLAPGNFSPGELSLPERPSKIPDILVEAAWLPRFCDRLRHELLNRKYGTGGLGLRICGDYFGGDTGPKDVGMGSWQDVNRTWTASGEDPVSTLGYAAIAANFALCLRKANQPDPEGIDWTREATEGFAWSLTHTHPGDEIKPDYRENKIYAAAALALLTGETQYTKILDSETSDMNAGTRLWWSSLSGPALYAASPIGLKDSRLLERFSQAVIGTADAELDSAKRRALRWGGDWGMPMLIGQQTTPWVQAMAVASVITRNSNPEKSRAYFGAVCTTADYFLGTNPLNQTWVTGLTDACPTQVFQMDSWYVQGSGIHPGIVPYGPWYKSNLVGQGPWDHDWANKSCYPPIDLWPGGERWFSNRCCPMTSEFTIWQNIAPTAFTYAFLAGSTPRT